MGKNESRSARKKAEKNMQTESKSGLSKVYYWIIGGLFLILLLLVVYIFAKSGDQVNLGNEDETNSMVQENETETTDNSEAKDKKENSSTETEKTDEEASEEPTKEEQDTEEESTDESSEDEVVDEDAPLDTDYAVDYTSGSADRVAIKNKVMQATGLGNDLIESWVGNNGPGRVTADVHSPDQSEVYRVYLQYGDGEWHVTNYESLSSVPNNQKNNDCGEEREDEEY